MPLPGGATDKLGNRYEGRWTVFCMVDVMDEKADFIHLEKPGEDSFEFFVSRNSQQLECHQVKRQKSGLGHWTLSALENTQIQVLTDFWGKLSDPDIFCVFVSTQDADQLRELADRARSAQSWVEFEQEFLKSSKQSTNFSNLCKIWGNCPQIKAYEALQRIRAETVGEEFLLNVVESRIAALVEGDSKTVRLELAELVLEKIHHKLTAYDIWHELENRGYCRRQWGKDLHVIAAVKTVNESYLSSLQDMSIAGRPPISRDEVQTVCDRLTGGEGKRSVLLVGEAGVGKTGVMLQVVEQLRQHGLPILAFRIDNLNPEPMPDNVGQQLGLPGSPAVVLANIAQGGDCVLVIDQIDAVSLASGRNPQFFICIEQIIKQAQAYPNMRLLLACRKFDLDNDSRFKKLTGEKGVAETLFVNRLSYEKVREVVAEIGLDETRLTERQLNLLSIPLHLSLLAEIPQDTAIDTLSFTIAKDLLDQFWKYKQLRVKERLGRVVQWTQVINLLCDRLSNEQIQGLSVSENIVDDYVDDAMAMAAEHVLAWEGKRIRFFHEAFFDYAFARSFAARGQNLLSFLRSAEQHLFRRAQLRQILIHEREADFEQYLNDLSELLNSTDIRFHLKRVVFALLVSLPDPREEEWQLISRLINEPAHPLSQEAWRVLRSSVQWFKLLDSLGIVEQWLYGEDEYLTNQVISILSMMQNSVSERVVELISPFIGTSDIWFHRLKQFTRSDLYANRCSFDLFLKLIQAGVCDQQSDSQDNNEDFWLQIYSLKEKKPDWACEAIACYLNHYLDLGIVASQPNIFDRKSGVLPQSRVDHEILQECAQKSPESFAVQVLPFVIRILKLTVQGQNDLPWSDPIWTYPYKVGRDDIEDSILSSLQATLSSLAQNRSNLLLDVLEQIRNLDFEITQYLLMCIYLADGQGFADEAVDYLCNQPTRLKVSYLCDSYWTARQLLEAITPYCSNERLEQLGKVLLNYYPDGERGAYHDHAQLTLLEGIVSFRRSEKVSERLGQLYRKFEQQPNRPSNSLVSSVIPESATEEMTDKRWLKAIAKYKFDQEYRGKEERFVDSEASLLPESLRNQVEREPKRFAKLVQQFPDDTHPSYFNAVLRGIAGVGTEIEIVLAVCKHCHQLPQRPCGLWISCLIGEQAELPWTQEAFDILTWYALNDPDPRQELWRTQAANGQVYYRGDVLMDGINTVRGTAANAIASLISADKTRVPYFQSVLIVMVSDPSIAVRARVAEALSAVLNYDRDLAIQLFLDLCATEDVLLGTQTVKDFLYYAAQTHFETLKPIIERMIASDLPDVIQAGSRQACVASLRIKDARSLAVQCLSGTESHQLGAAEIFVMKFRSAYFREFCQTGLVRLFQSTSEKVRNQVARCFSKLEEDELSQHIELANQFIQSPAFIDNSYDLIRALEKTTARLPELTYSACDRYANHLIEQHARSGRVFREVNSISQLLVKVYSQSTINSNLQSQCLDLIDRLAEMEVYGLEKALDEFER
jgi:hypothetical protein